MASCFLDCSWLHGSVALVLVGVVMGIARRRLAIPITTPTRRWEKQLAHRVGQEYKILINQAR